MVSQLWFLPELWISALIFFHPLPAYSSQVAYNITLFFKIKDDWQIFLWGYSNSTLILEITGTVPEWPGNPCSTLSAILGGYIFTYSLKTLCSHMPFGKRRWLAHHWRASCLSGLFAWDLNHWALCRQPGSTAALEIFFSNLQMTPILWKVSPKTDIFN